VDFGDAPGVLVAVDDLAQAGRAVGDGVLAQLDADPAAAHLVGDGSGGAGAEEGVEDEVAGQAPRIVRAKLSNNAAGGGVKVEHLDGLVTAIGASTVANYVHERH
jgi:hypothetical protein